MCVRTHGCVYTAIDLNLDLQLCVRTYLRGGSRYIAVEPGLCIDFSPALGMRADMRVQTTHGGSNKPWLLNLAPGDLNARTRA